MSNIPPKSLVLCWSCVLCITRRSFVGPAVNEITVRLGPGKAPIKARAAVVVASVSEIDYSAFS